MVRSTKSCRRQIIFLCIPPYNIIVKKNIFVILLLIGLSCFCVGCSAIGVEYEGVLPTYSISATLDTQTMTLDGEVTLTYTYNGENTLSHLVFAVYPNAESRNTEIIGVSADGKQIGFSELKDGSFLEIPLPRELFPQEKIDVSINYRLKIPNSSGILGYTESETKLSGWYPVLCAMEQDEWVEQTLSGYGDRYFSDVADYEVRLTVQKDEIVASSGKRVGVINSGDKVTYTYSGKNVRDFAFCVSRDYVCVSGVSGVTLVNVYAYNNESAESVLRYAKQALNFFGERFGVIERDTFSVALCGLDAGGMEFSGIVYINKDLKDRELEEVVVHETAHQWWYGGVGSNPTEYAWLDEGLTEYSVLEYVGEYYGVLERSQKVNDTYSLYESFHSVAQGVGVDCGMTQNTAKFNSLYHYVIVTYTKGALFFENLREITGNTAFKKALKTYYQTFKHKKATPDDLKSTLQDVVGKINYTPIFDYWE